MKTTLALTVFCSTINFLFCQQNPTISYITKEQVVNIGDTVELRCSVQYAADYPVLWVKINSENPSNNLFISTGSTQIVPDQRYSIRHDEHSSTFTLQITKLQEIDAGMYQCQVIIGSTSKLTSDVWVYVRIPPVISDNSTRSVITSSGATVTLHCYAAGFPPPRISWRRENNDLLPTGGAVYRGNVLTIHNITKDDRGTYYCIADNGVGRGARRNVGVEVEFSPFITVDRPRYGQALQYDMDLLCHVEAFPSPSIIWLKDGFQLNDDQHYKISIYATANEFTDTSLRITRIEKKQYGNFTCKAINKLGSDEKKVELFETVNVICPPACGLGLYSTADTFVATSLMLLLCSVAATVFLHRRL